MQKNSRLLLPIYILLFSTIFVLSKQIIPPLNAISYIVLRGLIGSIPFVLTFYKNREHHMFFQFIQFIKTNLKDIFFISIVGQMGALLLIFFATPFTTTGNQAVLNTFATPMVLFINWVFFKTRSSPKVILGIIISTIGVILIIFPFSFSANATLKGDLMVILGMILGAYENILFSKLSKKTDPLFIAFSISVFPSIMLIPFMGVDNQFDIITQMSLPQWFLIIWLGISISWLGYLVVSHIFSDPDINAEIFGVLAGLVTISGLILGILIYHEEFLLINLVGAGLVILATFFVNSKKLPKSTNIKVQ